MPSPRVLDQHIAVFGQSGSGKTVLVSSFYGAMQEPEFLSSSLFDVTADDAGQGNRLHGNYLGMKDADRAPEPTRFAATPYAFTVKLRDRSAKTDASRPFDALRLVWHDYPGEWFEQDVSGPEEARRRVATFRSLLSSDVAFLLVDGQRLVDHAGEEERYLKGLFASFRTGLLRVEDDLLADGKPLVRFPRIWVLALSKADLVPDLDVFAFRDLVIGKAADDLAQLRQVLEGFVETPEAMSVGEDFVRLSSAKFEPGKIEVDQRIGLDLILPLASVLPFERHITWVERLEVGTKVAQDLLIGASALATALIGKGLLKGSPKTKLLAVKGMITALIGKETVNAVMSAASKLGGDQLRKAHADALAKRDHMAAVLTQFQLDLDRAEDDRVLLRSRR